MFKEALIGEATKVSAFVTNEDGWDVAVLERIDKKYPWGDPRLTDDEWQSLVNLVNAAPALLDALKELLAANNLVDDEYYEAIVQAEVKARAAIDKATK